MNGVTNYQRVMQKKHDISVGPLESYLGASKNWPNGSHPDRGAEPSGIAVFGIRAI